MFSNINSFYNHVNCFDSDLFLFSNVEQGYRYLPLLDHECIKLNHRIIHCYDLTPKKFLTVHSLNKSFKFHEVVSFHEKWTEPKVGKR